MLNTTTNTDQKVKGISLRLVLVLVIFAIILLLFLLITEKFVLEGGNNIDASVFTFLENYTSPTTTAVMNFFTFFGSTRFLFPAYLLLALFYIVFKKNTRRSLNITAIGLGSLLLMLLIKSIFKRHRPPDPLIAAAKGFSYPSGHSTSAFTFCGILIYILWESKVSKVWKWAGTFALLLFAGIVAISRVYLHVHYASDVLAGFCLSFLWLTICIFILRRINNSGKVDKGVKA
ncbi:MAG: phosphatase family protein [Segetibacter sp.]|nr:phosphatase family protein [Segetibacter sp.]